MGLGNNTDASGADLTRLNEGLTLVAIHDTRGFSIGYGHDGAKEGDVWTQDQADAAFDQDYPLACSRAEADLGAAEYAALSPQRQAVLNDMAYEIGGAGLAQFKNMLAAIKVTDWPGAAAALKTSELFSQVQTRENRNIQVLLTGDWPT